MWLVATLELEAGFTLTKIFGPICFFSSLITHLFSDVGFGSVSWEHLFFYWFQGRNLLVHDQNFKRGWDIKKKEDQISRGKSFFPYLSIKTCVTFSSCYSCFSRYYLKMEMPRLKLMAALFFEILWLRY